MKYHIKGGKEYCKYGKIDLGVCAYTTKLPELHLLPYFVYMIYIGPCFVVWCGMEWGRSGGGVVVLGLNSTPPTPQTHHTPPPTTTDGPLCYTRNI
jgi:hypothetical protein